MKKTIHNCARVRPIIFPPLSSRALCNVWLLNLWFFRYIYFVLFALLFSFSLSHCSPSRHTLYEFWVRFNSTNEQQRQHEYIPKTYWNVAAMHGVVSEVIDLWELRASNAFECRTNKLCCFYVWLHCCWCTHATFNRIITFAAAAYEQQKKMSTQSQK